MNALELAHPYPQISPKEAWQRHYISFFEYYFISRGGSASWSRKKTAEVFFYRFMRRKKVLFPDEFEKFCGKFFAKHNTGRFEFYGSFHLFLAGRVRCVRYTESTKKDKLGMMRNLVKSLLDEKKYGKGA